MNTTHSQTVQQECSSVQRSGSQKQLFESLLNRDGGLQTETGASSPTNSLATLDKSRNRAASVGWWWSWRLAAMRCQKLWSQLRRLMYTTPSWEAKVEFPGEALTHAYATTMEAT